jgi:hypothetical protein
MFVCYDFNLSLFLPGDPDVEQAGGGAGAHRVRARHSTQRAREGARQEGRGQGAPTPPTPHRRQGRPRLIPPAQAFVIHCAVVALSFWMRILSSKILDDLKSEMEKMTNH